MRTIGPPNNLGTLLGITSFGIFVAISLLSSRIPSMSYSIIAGVIGISAISALALFLSYRKEEWLYFYGTEPHTYVCYCRRGADSENFDSFTAAVVEAIREKANEQCGAPKSPTVRS